MTESKPQVQEAQKTSSEIFQTMKTITIKRKSWRQLEEKSHSKYKETKIRMRADFSLETM